MNSSDIVVRLRHALARGVADAHGGDWPGLAGGGAHAAAVLVPLVRREEEPTVLLTRRTSHLRHHAGQIGFPGGGVEAGDDCAEATALRETREEIGLSSERIELIGRLPDYLTGTGFRITPVVGLLRPPLDLAALVIDTFEVAEVFEVPLAFFLDPANHRQHSLAVDGQIRHFHAMPYGDHFIWGATAGMLMSLYRLLEASDATGGDPGGQGTAR